MLEDRLDVLSLVGELLELFSYSLKGGFHRLVDGLLAGLGMLDRLAGDQFMARRYGQPDLHFPGFMTGIAVTRLFHGHPTSHDTVMISFQLLQLMANHFIESLGGFETVVRDFNIFLQSGTSF